MTKKDEALALFEKFLSRMSLLQELDFKDVQAKVSKDRLELSTLATPQNSEDEPFKVVVVYKKETGNIFYYREYSNSYQTQTETVRARSDESFRSILTRLYAKIKSR